MTFAYAMAGRLSPLIDFFYSKIQLFLFNVEIFEFFRELFFQLSDNLKCFQVFVLFYDYIFIFLVKNSHGVLLVAFQEVID
jgi:hypothetical protein